VRALVVINEDRITYFVKASFGRSFDTFDSCVMFSLVK